jgi:hypothetical protein
MSAGSRFFRSDAAADFVALDGGNGLLRCVAARIAGGRLTVLKVAETEWPADLVETGDVQAMAERVRRLIRDASLKSPRALIVVPRDAVVVRKLDLPEIPDNELPDLVRLQAATKLATPVDKLALDYVPLTTHAHEAGRSVLLMSLDHDRLQKVCAAVEAAGMEPVGCVPSSISVANLALQSAGGADPSGLTLVVYQYRDRLELSALLDRQLIFSHALSLPDGESAGHTQPLMAELSRVLVAVRQVRHEAEIERVLVVQDGEPDEPVLATLRERFGPQLQVVTREQISRGARLDRTAPAEASTAALGAIVAEAAALIPLVDFLRPRRAAPQADPQKRVKQLAAAAAGLFVLVAGSVYYSMLSSRDAEIARLEQRRVQLDELVGPKNAETQATLAAAGLLNDWSGEAESPLQVLRELQALHPGTGRLYMTRLLLTPETGEATARVTGDGFARSESDVRGLNQRLADAGHVVTAKPTSRSTRNPDYPVAFELNVRLMPAKPKIADKRPAPGSPES